MTSSPESDYDVTVEASVMEDGAEGISVKIYSTDWELNVHMRQSELPLLHEVLRRRWESGAVSIGPSASARVFWWSDGDAMVYIGVGHDVETWDFGINFPVSTFEEIIAEIVRETGRPW